MIANFIVSYKFYIGEFLAQVLKDRAVGRQKELLAYPCMLTQIFLAVGVMELPGIEKMIEAQSTFDIGLIRDATNHLSKTIREAINVMAGLFP